LEAQALHSKRPEAPEIQEFQSGGQALLEAQVVDAADSLAYDTHDLDDALSLGLITPVQLQNVEFWSQAEEEVRRRHPLIAPEQFQATMVRALINWQVTDLLEHTRQRLQEEGIGSVGDVRQAGVVLAGPGPEVRALKAGLERFLHERVYRHYRVTRMAHKGRRFLQSLFEEFCRRPEQLPERHVVRTRTEQPERVVCDYLAGMTDRYAQDEYLRLFQPYTNV
jgi:dGTPase